MRNRNTLLLLVFLVLAGFAAYFFLNKNETKSTLNPKETNFSVTDTASVTKIFISDKYGNSNTIERKDESNWVINNKYEARKDLVKMLLETLTRMEVKRPVDKNSRNETIRDFATLGRKVEIYQNGELSKTFYVGQTTDNDMGTYFIMEGSENPYVLHIPGFQGFLSTRFDLNETKWRSVPVFRNTLASLEQLKIEYPKNPAGNFTVEKTADNKYTLNGKALTPEETENVKAYLENYAFINGEFYYPNPMNRVSDSLASQKYATKISVKDRQPEKTATFLLYEIPGNGDRQVALNPKTKEVISVQNFVFNRLLVRKEALVKK